METHPLNRKNIINDVGLPQRKEEEDIEFIICLISSHCCFLTLPRRHRTALIRVYMVCELGYFVRHWLCHRTLSNFKYISDWGSPRRFIAHALRRPQHSVLKSPKPADFPEKLTDYCKGPIRTSDTDPQTAASDWCFYYFLSNLAPASGDIRVAPGRCCLHRIWSVWFEVLSYLSARICDGRPSSVPCSATGDSLGF